MNSINPNSILDSVKKALGYASDYDAFDPDIIMHINSTFFTLTQLGAGPSGGYLIEDDTALWSDFTPDINRILAIKSYIYVKVRLLFDPPATSFALAAMQELAKEYEWRIHAQVGISNRVIVVLPETPQQSDIDHGDIWDLTDLTDFPANAPVGAIGVDLKTGDTWKKV